MKVFRASACGTRWLISMIRLDSVVGESHSSWWSGTSRRVLGLCVSLGLFFDWDVLGWDCEWIEGIKWEVDVWEGCILTSNQSSLVARRLEWLRRRSLAL